MRHDAKGGNQDNTYHWLIKIVRRDRKSKLIENERHERAITHMSRNLVSNIDVLQSRYILDRTQASDRVQSPARRSEKVVKHPIVARISVDEPPRNNGTNFEPCAQRRGDGRPEDEHILDYSVCLLLRELNQGVKDDSCTEREPDEGNWSDAKLPVQ